MKIRMDFVTNSSSSSFVCYAIRSPELAELLEKCKRHKWIEACSFLETGPEGIVVNRQIGQIRYIPYYVANSLYVEELIDPDIEYDENGNYNEEDYEYTSEKQEKDIQKMMDTDIISEAITAFIDNCESEDTLEKIDEIIQFAFDNDDIECRVFVDETDGYCGYTYDSFFSEFKKCKEIVTEISDDFMYSHDGGIIEYLGTDKRVVIPQKINDTFITYIDSCAFDDSPQIEELIISDGFVSEIDFFYSDNYNKFKNLKYIYLPNSVSVIGNQSFANCVNLKGLYIPESVERIDEHAFANCPNLENVYLAGGKGIYASALNTHHSPDLVIRGADKSLAQKYAKRANVPFVIDTRDRETIEARLMAEARGQVFDDDFWEYDETITPEKELNAILNDIDEVYKNLETVPENSNQFSQYLKGITLHRFMKLVMQVYDKPLIPWLTENGYIKPVSDKEKLELIYKKLRERYPEGSALPEKVSGLIAKNTDIIPTTFKKLVATVEGKSEKEWFVENGFLVSQEMKAVAKATEKAEKATRAAEEKAAKAAAEKAALLESLENVEKRDESVLKTNQSAMLQRTLEKLEEFYPEHKTYAMDSLCSNTRENAVVLSKVLGYNSVAEFLYVYGYEQISGAEVYELRKNCGYTPGNEPALVKERVDNTVSKLNEYYPNRVIEGSLQKSHENIAYTIQGLWQWLGYKDSVDFLAAYGFTYIVKSGGQFKVDPVAIVEELKNRYPDGTDMSVQQIAADNKDLSIKTLSNTSHQVFGMKLSEYFYEQGILANPPKGYRGHRRPETLTSVRPEVTEPVVKEKIETVTEIPVVPETKTEIPVTETVGIIESHADKDDETILREYTELLTSRIGTYPKKNISFEDLKFFNSDISFGTLNRITIKLHGEKAIRYCTRMGFMKNKEEE